MDRLLQWDCFRDWVHCIAVVTFDLELGQTLESITPNHIRLTEEEKSTICYLSFPDSNSGCMGDTQFHFRLRHTPSKMDMMLRDKKESLEYNRKCPLALQTEPHFLFAYVQFRQVKDPSLRRGYFQKSVVLLSKFPFLNLFYSILDRLAPEFFESGQKNVDDACNDICQWPRPIPGEVLNLPFLGSVFQVYIPTATCARSSGGSPLSTPNSTGTPTIGPSPSSCNLGSGLAAIPTVIASVHEPDLFLCLRPVLSHIHLLWELVVTAEPLVVMATLPNTAANTVQALISMIFPLKYSGDQRPYFTIHDTDLKEYTMKGSPPPSVLLGVTNPFFAKTLQHWPHVIRMGDSINSAPKLNKAANIKLLDSQPGLYTNYKPFLQKDKNILKKVLMGMQSQRPGLVQSIILRRHLHELTESFMIPLERYLGTLMPLHKDICPSKATPLPRPFNPDQFLATLDISGPQLTTGIRGDWGGLYKRFFRSVNFSQWYNLRYQEAVEQLQSLHLEVIANTDVLSWMSGRNEVEAVDLVLRLRDKLSQNHLPLKTLVREKLEKQVEAILSTLPEDLRAVLKPNATPSS